MPWKNGNPPSYTVWRGILHRCYSPKAKQYKDYGGRGIKVCDAWWHDYKQFYADMGDCPPGLTIERRDNDGDYSPENCYWATRQEQQRNRRNTIKVTVEGKEYLAMDLATIADIKTDCLVERVKKGLSYNEVVSKEKLKPKICKKGHALTEDNTETNKRGTFCKTCAALRYERFYGHSRTPRKKKQPG